MHYKVTKNTINTLDTFANQWSALLFILGILIIVAFLYLDRAQEISNTIRSTGLSVRVLWDW